MSKFLVLAFFIGGAVAFVLYQIYQFFLGISGTRSVFVKDLEILNKSISTIELAPWDSDELDILSRIGESDVERSVFGEIETGVIFSIYHEPILAFATKIYKNTLERIFLLKINGDKYTFLPKKDHWEIKKNERDFGDLNITDRIEIKSKGRTLSIDNRDTTSLKPVKVNDEVFVSINTDEDDKNQQSRVIHQVKQFENNDEELFLVALGYAIIDHQI